MNLNRIPFLHMNNWIYWGFTMYLLGCFFQKLGKADTMVCRINILSIYISDLFRISCDTSRLPLNIYTQAHLSWDFS